MNQVLEHTAAACAVLIAAEVIGRFCAKNAMLQFVKALTAAALLLSAAVSLFQMEPDFGLALPESGGPQKELSSYLEEQYGQAAGKEAERSLRGLFAAAGLEAEKIEVFTDITEDSGIVLTKVSARFAYDSDARRARVLLRNTLGDSLQIEVETDGA